MGMDRVVKKKRLPLKWIIGIAAAAVLVAVFGYQLLIVDHRPLQTARKTDLRIAIIVKGDFQEYFQTNCYVAPAKSVFIDAEEAGMVREIYVEQGDVVRKGQVVARLRNDELEAELATVEANLRGANEALKNQGVLLERARLQHRGQLLDLDHQMEVIERDIEQKYIKDAAELIPDHMKKKAQRELAFLQEKWDILVKSQRLELETIKQGSEKVKIDIDLLSISRRRLARRLQALQLASPALGQIIEFQASVGEMKVPGSRIALLQSLEDLKLKGVMDEFYLPKISIGGKGTFTYLNTRGDEEKGSATIVWVSPDVKNNTFEVDFRFDREILSLRLGQRFEVRVELGKKREAVLLEQGQFFQASGGRWVYVVEPSGSSAVKREIVAGKSNPDYLEVVDGLVPGEQVVVSDYSAFQNLDKISLK